MEEVIWKTSVMMPICAKEKLKLSLTIGYKDGMMDWIMSLRKCEMLHIMSME